MLDQRWPTLTRQLDDALNASRQQVQFGADYQGEGVWVGLLGSSCERISRNRGGDTNVAPLCTLPNNLVAWLGIREVWELRTGQKPFVFRELGLTVHFGFAGEVVKPQILRLEWPGVRDWTGSGLGFQSPGAGHPHWQIDILESLASGGESATFDGEIGEIVEDFGVEPQSPRLDDLLRSMTIENMHFASAAPWWLASAADQPAHHMNAPDDLQALTRWLFAGVQYIRQELARCFVR